jgi:tetratricopeptide (TPR) repeat protein
MQELHGTHRPTTEMLEFLAELFNASNRETDYAQALLKLFDLYCTKHDYQKAGECLDRAAEVDPYEPGTSEAAGRHCGARSTISVSTAIASRFTRPKKEEHEVKVQEPTLGAAALQDLMLQAEILVQYGMRSKAIERLQRIQELFPREEERNQELQKLYMAAGIAAAICEAGCADASGVDGDAAATGCNTGLQRRRRARRPTSAVWREWRKSRASFISRGTPKEC